MTHRLQKQQVIDALRKSFGAVYTAASILKVSHTAVYKWLEKDADVREVKEFYDNELLDVAELKLRQAIMAGEGWAIKYLLATKGRARGYVERTESDVNLAGEGQVILYLPKNGREKIE